MSYNASGRAELTVSDGFRFGCGFILAATVAYLILGVLLLILSIVFSGVIAGLIESAR